MRSAFAAVLIALLAACSSAPREELPAPRLPERAGVDEIVAARAEGVQFYATGAGFALNLYRDDRITLAWDERAFTFPKPDPILPRWNGEIYETQSEQHTLRVEIRRLSCTDPDRNGETLPARVTVILDGEAREGCGRSL